MRGERDKRVKGTLRFMVWHLRLFAKTRERKE